MSWTLIYPSGCLAVTDQPTRAPQPTNPQPTGATTFSGSSASPALLFHSQHSAALSPGYSPTASSSVPPSPQRLKPLAPHSYRLRGTKASRAPPYALAKILMPPPTLSPPDRNPSLFAPPHRFPIFINAMNLADSPQARQRLGRLRQRKAVGSRRTIARELHPSGPVPKRHRRLETKTARRCFNAGPDAATRGTSGTDSGPCHTARAVQVSCPASVEPADLVSNRESP
jgi:hypothetical protein